MKRKHPSVTTVLAFFWCVGSAAAQEAATFQVDHFAITLQVAPEHPDGYNRDDWPHWNAHVGGGCFTVRDKVLAEESVVPVQTVPGSGGRCRVTAGQWNGPYTGQTFTDAGDVQIDHFVPLKEAYDSGGFAWDRDRRQLYANDLTYADHLVAVQGAENNRKSDQDPADYLPPNDAYKCHYLQTWVIIKQRWGLTIDTRERDAITQGLAEWCGGQ